jgi:tripartite-type tricarboxylate transporter receptor subunit TctC
VKRRSLLLGAVGAAASATTLAQAPFPNRPVTLVVPFPPGAGTDATARLVGRALAERLGQPVLVQNIPGAGGSIGAGMVAKAANDGHTLLFATANTLTSNAALYPKLAYAPSDFEPISLVGAVPLVVAVHTAQPFAHVADIVAAARSKPGTVSFASAGNGTFGHLAGELFAHTAGVQLMHVPYKGIAPAAVAVGSGETALAMTDLTSVQPLVAAGKVKLVAVFSPQRSALLPNVRTMVEQGLPAATASAWTALVAPKGTPAAVLTRLRTELHAVLNTPEVRQALLTAGIEPKPGTGEELAELIRTETDKWKSVIVRAKIAVE